MRHKLEQDLLFIFVCTLVLILIITLFPIKPLRIALGLPFILFFPGYTLIAALFPRREDLDPIERVALSFGLSIAVVPLIGLALNYTPWGIRLYPILVALTIFILGTGIAAWRRRVLFPPSERFTVNLRIPVRSWWSSWESSTRLDRALTVALILSILGALGTLGYVIAKPKVGEKFTEFYILGPYGKAADYPRRLRVGQEGKVILGIVNHEYKDTKYRVEIKIAGKKIKELGPIVLANKEKWERMITFAPTEAGENQKVEFLLYKDNEDTVYLSLHLWVDVVAR